MSTKTGVSNVIDPFGHKRLKPKKPKTGAGFGEFITAAMPYIKKAGELGASTVCGILAKKAMGSGITRSGDGKKKKKVLRGGCQDCTMKLKKQLRNLKL